MARKELSASGKVVGVGVVALFIYLSVLVVMNVGNDSTSSRAPRATRQPSSFTVSWTNTPRPTVTNQVVATATRANTPTPTLEVLAYDAVLYAKENAIVRGCPASDCANMGVIGAGDAVAVTGMVDGEIIVTGYEVWFVVDYDGGVGYVYQTLLTNQAIASPTPAPTSDSASVPVVNTCPKNCATAVANGWSAQMAGQCDNLDRDNDGVACYGD